MLTTVISQDDDHHDDGKQLVKDIDNQISFKKLQKYYFPIKKEN